MIRPFNDHRRTTRHTAPAHVFHEDNITPIDYVGKLQNHSPVMMQWLFGGTDANGNPQPIRPFGGKNQPYPGAE